MNLSFQFTVDGRVGPDMDRVPNPVDPDPSPGVIAVITPAFGGNYCSGSSTSFQSCNTHNCPMQVSIFNNT